MTVVLTFCKHDNSEKLTNQDHGLPKIPHPLPKGPQGTKASVFYSKIGHF